MCQSDQQPDINECARKPCQHGRCVNKDGGYKCTCSSGWTGRNCQQEISKCTRNSCQHGRCVNKDGGYKCTCSPGWTGQNCQQDLNECTKRPCQHGRCMNKDGGYKCTCNPGWTGQNCQQDINECARNPCQHARCVNKDGGYTCICLPGWTGQNCQQKISKCTRNSCQHGRCVNKDGGYKCTCSPGWTGQNCRQGVNVALGKPAYQTSTHDGPADRAVDGNTNGKYYHAGSCTHTVDVGGGETDPSWWVDLGQSYKVDRVVIFNRRDCCQERLNPFNIHIGDSAQVSENPKCGGNHHIDVNQPSISVSCQGMTGRYVGVRLPGPIRKLTLCEVQVFSETVIISPSTKSCSGWSAFTVALSSFTAASSRRSLSEGRLGTSRLPPREMIRKARRWTLSIASCCSHLRARDHTRAQYNTVYSASPSVPAFPRVGSPSGLRPSGDPTRGRADTSGDTEYPTYVHLVLEGGPKGTISATRVWEKRSPGLKQTHGANDSVQILPQLKTLARTTLYQVSSLKGSKVEAYSYWLVLHYVQHDRQA
ncbi:hypothetical protein Bbelb_352230 [Branchiostoma belcheri]|nr:hypothetical protein Bbelb_352230 [Branchiostoma belcheri]